MEGAEAWALGLSCLALGPSGVAIDHAGAIAIAQAKGLDVPVIAELLGAIQAGMFTGQSKKRERDAHG